MEQENKTTHTIEVAPSLETTHTLDLSDKLYKVMLGLIALAVVFGAGELLYQFRSLPQNMPREIMVSGEGKAYAKPDVAMVNFGVTTEAKKSQDAVNQKILEDLMARMKQREAGRTREG